MTGDLAIETRKQLDGNSWGVMLSVSVILHLFVFSAVVFLSGLMQSGDIDNIVYEVDLVEMPAVSRAPATSSSRNEEAAVNAETSAKRIDAGEEKKKTIAVEKISVTKKKTAVKKEDISPRANKNKTSEDANHLNSAISNLKKKTKAEETHLNQAMSRLQNKLGGGTAAKGGASGGGEVGSLFMEIYKVNVKSHIQDNWSYPAAMQNRKDLEVTVLLKVKEDGVILKSEFIKKSRDSIFDQSVLKAIERSNPIPPFPEGYEKSYEEFEIRFTLKELMDN